MVIEIDDIDDPRIAAFRSMTDAALRQQCECAEGIFIAESPKVIEVALSRGYEPVSLLCERRHIAGDASAIVARFADMPVCTGTRETLSVITGYRPLPPLAELTREARLVCVLESVSDTTNIGAIFRSACAMGVDAVVLSADSCDPLNRRAVRVSMGNVFNVPWTVDDDPVAELSRLGFTTAALALRHDNLSLDDPRLKTVDRLAVVFGTEGDGLRETTIARCDYVVRIPMHHEADSLNVAAAAAVTFWELRRRE